MREKKLASLKTDYEQMVNDAQLIENTDIGDSPEAVVMESFILIIFISTNDSFLLVFNYFCNSQSIRC